MTPSRSTDECPRICANRTAGVDVKRTLRIASTEVAVRGLVAVRLVNVAGLNCIHSSGSPALRRPSNRFGIGGPYWVDEFDRDFGLEAEHFRKGGFGFVHLARERRRGGKARVRPHIVHAEVDRLVVVVDRGVELPKAEFRVAQILGRDCSERIARA